MTETKDSSTSVGAEYMHPRTYRDSARLHLQHWIWKEHLGYLLHPSIPPPPPTARIADIGTGNACWLLDLSQKAPPTWSLEGFDISAQQFPVSHNLPSNVSLTVHDVFDPVPAHLRAKFDIVHVRAFGVVIKNGDPGPLTRNMIAMLKPGGYLQWDEFDSASFSAHSPSPEIAKTKTEEIIRTFNGLAEALKLDWSWTAEGVMATSFRDNGLVVVNDTVADRWSRPEEFKPLLRKAYTDNWMIALEETAGVILSRGGEVGGRVTLEVFRELLGETARETVNGVSIWIDLMVVVGQVPI